jgi:hypothetical protein
LRDDSARAFHARASRKKETRRPARQLNACVHACVRACVRVRAGARVRARGCALEGRDLSLSLSLGKPPKDLSPQKYSITTAAGSLA